MKEYTNKRLLSIYPAVRGFGYSVWKNDASPYCYDRYVRRGNKTIKFCIKQLEFLFKFYEPEVIALYLKKREGKHSKALINAIIKLAEEKQVPISFYEREDIQKAFLEFEVTTKCDIANLIGSWFETKGEKEVRLPKIHHTDYYTVPIYDALALGLTHYWNSD